MAVTIRTYDLAAFWNTDTLLTTLQTALSDVGYHAAAQTGTILTISASAGTNLTAARGKRYLVSQFSTNGSGVYATFDIFRHAFTGAPTVTLVRGGKNYAAGNTCLIKGSQIGGVDTTDDITVTVSTVSTSSGSATTWYDSDTTSTGGWAVCCVNNDETKRLGQTYYSFYMAPFTTATVTQPILYIKTGSGFNPSAGTFMGTAGIDCCNASPGSATGAPFAQTIATSNTTPLRLTTYQSAVDTNFVVFQFSDTTKYGNLYRNPFFLSKYSSATQPWSLDECYTGGIYEITKVLTASTYDCAVTSYLPLSGVPKRQGEWGYSGTQSSNLRGLQGYYESLFGKRYLAVNVTATVPTIYMRSVADLVQTSLEYNPVITGIPINNVMVPVPYFIPNDFGIVEVLGSNSMSYLDQVSVGATTKWRIVQYANNLTSGYNSSICFVAKEVN